MVFGNNNSTLLKSGTQLNDGSYLGRSVAYSRPLNNGGTSAAPVGMHTSYETDADGNRVEVVYDASGKIISSKNVGTAAGSEFNAGRTAATPQFNAGNWQKLVELLKSKFGISI